MKNIIDAAKRRLNHAIIINEFTKQVLITYEGKVYSVIFFESVEDIINCTSTVQVNLVSEIVIVAKDEDVLLFD